MVALIDSDIEKYRNLAATLYLRDASQREYPVHVSKITPSHIGRAIGDIPVRDD